MPDNSYDDTSFPLKLLLTDAQVSRLRKAFANNLPAYLKQPSQDDCIGAFNPLELITSLEVIMNSFLKEIEQDKILPKSKRMLKNFL